MSTSSRTKSTHFSNPFRSVVSSSSSSGSFGSSTPGSQRKKGSTASLAPSTNEDPNLIVSQLSELPENSFCADCGASDPRYLSSTLGLWLCKECGQIHKEILGPQFSDIRSLDLGLGFWSPETIKLLQSMGNQKGNKLWEHNHTSSKLKKPQSETDRTTKESWIVAKYQLMEFWKMQRDYLNVKVIQVSKKVKPTWVRRWFVVKWDIIELFEAKEKEEGEPLEKIDLLLATAKEADPGLLTKDKKIDPACCFQISGPDKIYLVQCSTVEELDEWLFSIKITTQRLRLQLTSQGPIGTPTRSSSSTNSVSLSSPPNSSSSSSTFTQGKVLAGASRVASGHLGSAAAAAGAQPLPSGGASPTTPTASSGGNLLSPAGSTSSIPAATGSPSVPMKNSGERSLGGFGLSSSSRSLIKLAEDGEASFVRDPKLSSASLLATLAKTNEMKEQQRATLQVRLDSLNKDYSQYLAKKQAVEHRLAELEKTLQESSVKEQNIRLRLIQLEPENQMVIRAVQPPSEDAASTAGGAGLLQKEDGSIQGGTVTKLVQMLTHETYLDTEYLNAFLLTYRSFTTPMDLLEKLKQRFQIQPPPFITAEDMKRFQDTMQRPIRLRVFNVLKHWILNHYYDFSVDNNLTHKLLDFLDEVMEPSGMGQPAEQLRKLLKQKIKGQYKAKQVMIDEARIPKPLLPANLESFSFSDLDCLEVARQMCILEQGLYKAILPRECLNQAWNHKTYKETAAPNILSIIRRFNRVSAWAAAEVVQKELLPDRVKTLERLILVAHHCRELHNFNATQSILAGIAASSVFRMKKTWAGLDSEIMKKYDALKKVMSADSSFATLRAALHSESPPCIPYLGMYLTDLTFIEDGNPDFLQDGMINFAKRKRVAAVIREIQQYQQTPYALKPVPQLQDYISGLDGMDEKTAYDLSLLVEPREKTTVN